jgi:DNA-binding NtrC family response regulator
VGFISFLSRLDGLPLKRLVAEGNVEALMSSPTLSGLSILLVEDEVATRRRLAVQLERFGAEVTTAETLAAARQSIATRGFDFALLDVHLPDGLGTDLLRERVFAPDTGVVVLTAHGGVAGAVEAVRLGALDYLVKPFETEELVLALERGRSSRQSARVEEHRRENDSGDEFQFGASLAALKAQLDRILEADRRMSGALPAILIQGETGTGKTAIARWLHQRGPRTSRQLVEVNCSTLPETLAESELFGHEAGAFTDARKARMGLFEAANGGSLFLDELPSLSLPIQAKVLTAIEDGKIRRVGANKPIPVDARLIAATNRDLTTLVAQGQFREDLYHRLDLYRVMLPPLRERGEDISRLAELFARRLSSKHRLPLKRISATGRQRLLENHWPGNVRELAHELERAVVFEDQPELEFARLVPRSGDAASVGNPPWLNSSFCLPEKGFSLDAATDSLVNLALKQSEGNVSAAARLLGVPRDFIRYRQRQAGPRLDK